MHNCMQLKLRDFWKKNMSVPNEIKMSRICISNVSCCRGEMSSGATSGELTSIKVKSGEIVDGSTPRNLHVQMDLHTHTHTHSHTHTHTHTHTHAHTRPHAHTRTHTRTHTHAHTRTHTHTHAHTRTHTLLVHLWVHELFYVVGTFKMVRLNVIWFLRRTNRKMTPQMLTLALYSSRIALDENSPRSCYGICFSYNPENRSTDYIRAAGFWRDKQHQHSLSEDVLQMV